MSKTFVISDIHGAYKAFLQCIERSGIDKENDQLIFLGDCCDGWPEVKECVDELLSFKKLINIRGNHDEWALQWINGRYPHTSFLDSAWLLQGGQATVNSFGNVSIEKYKDFLQSSKFYHESNNMLFIHGGFNYDYPVNSQRGNYLMWDRDLIQDAQFAHLHKHPKKFGNYEAIFVGHTPTVYLAKSYTPQNYCNVWAIDTAASYNGPLTIMNVDTKEYFQSDIVTKLYPGIKAR